MSDIICSSCHQANPGSSKFCNHCGDPLPPPDSSICSNCGTANPPNRYYCDECGTRLVTDGLSEDTSSLKEVEDEVDTSIFSLPARKPGDVAELDPADLPDWLRGKDLEKQQERDKGVTGSVGTGDLPAWLHNESNPILDVPDEITTEHYNLLVDTDENLPNLPAREDANLPDWLADAASDKPDDSAVDVTPTGTISPDWMQAPDVELDAPQINEQTVADLVAEEPVSEFDFEDLFDFEESEPPPVAAPVIKDNSFEEDGDWLDELIDEDEPGKDVTADSGESEDWLSSDLFESDAGDDDWLNTKVDEADDLFAEGAATSQTAVSDQDVDIESDDESWLDALIDDGDETAVSDPIPDLADDAGDTFDDDDTDWLTDLGEGGTEPIDASPQSGTDDLPAWLGGEDDDLFAEEAIVLPTAVSSQDADIEFDDENWLDELIDDGDETTDFDSALDLAGGAGDTLDDDLFAEDAITSQTAVSDQDIGIESDDESWLDALIDDGDETAVSDSALDFTDFADDAGDTLDDDDTDWLADLGEGGTEPFDASPQSGTDDLSALLGGEDDESDDDEDFGDLFKGTELLADEGLDWLSVDGVVEPAPLGEDDIFAGGAVAAQAAVSATGDLGDLWKGDEYGTGDLGVDDEPDWLSEYGTDFIEPINDDDDESIAKETEEEQPEEQIDEYDSKIEDFFAAAVATSIVDDMFGDDTDTLSVTEDSDTDNLDDFSLDITDNDLAFATAMLGGDDELDWVGDSTVNVDEDLPDWLDDLDDEDGVIEEAPAEIVSAATATAIISEVPEWLADMEPGQAETKGGVALSDTIPVFKDDDFDSFAFSDDELSGADLPEWLHEETEEASVVATMAVAGDFIADEDIIDDLIDDADDFADIDLSDFPPIVPIEERLSKAVIPDWIEELIPAELTPEGAAPEPKPGLESTGPLVGIGGVIALQSAMSSSYDSTPVSQFTVTKEHQQQTALLRQLTQGERKLSSGMAQSDGKTSARMRMALIVVLSIVALIGLFGPSLVSVPTEPSPALVALHDELTAVSNKPVLVAFEYTPAMAGELNAEAETMLAALAENGSPVVVISQSAAGSTIAASYLPEGGTQIGMVTGGAVGLRQLADCVGETAVCTTLLGREVTPDEQELLRDVALIIVLTGERDSLFNWIEQVGTSSGLPVVAGLTSSIAPLAAPYYDSGQIAGMMVGLQETAVYQQQWQAEQIDNNIISRLNAQALLQLTAALLLIAGSIYYGIVKAKKNEKVGK